MEIIKKGTGQKSWSKEYSCTGSGNGGGGCGAQLLVSLTDIYHIKSTDISGSTDHYYTFKCPCCSVETDISDIPCSIKSKIKPKNSCSDSSDK